MSLILDRCTPSDAPAFAEACISTYERMPRHIATYGAIPRDTQLEYFTKVFGEGIESQSHPTPTKETHYLKVTDPVTKEIMSYAIWDYLPHGYNVEEDSFVSTESYPEGTNVALAKHMGRLTGELRAEHEGRRGPHWLLELLGTHPKYERRGAGAMLIRWPFAQADKEGLKSYVDGSSVGYALYRKCGFEDVGEINVDFDEYGAPGFGVHKWVGMLREPGKA